MKKVFIVMLVLIITVLLASACGKDNLDESNDAEESNKGDLNESMPQNGEYSLTVEGDSNLLYEPLEKSYKAGEHIFVKTVLVMDANATVKLNGEPPASKRLVQDKDGRYLYNEHEFVMPAKDSVVSLSVTGGMGVLSHSLTVTGEQENLYEPPKALYEPGERVTVKTHLICDAEVVVELNGAKPHSRQLVTGEDGRYIYEEWEFIMPDKDSVISIYTRPGMDAIYYDVDVVDPDNLVINQLSGMYARGEGFHVNSLHSDLEITVNGEILHSTPEAILNDSGELLYYSWSGFEIVCDITVSVLAQATAE